MSTHDHCPSRVRWPETDDESCLVSPLWTSIHARGEVEMGQNLEAPYRTCRGSCRVPIGSCVMAATDIETHPSVVPDSCPDTDYTSHVSHLTSGGLGGEAEQQET
nr:hypothetical protein CFP56_00756 [Quercus suber]